MEDDERRRPKIRGKSWPWLSHEEVIGRAEGYSFALT
jgi:hypothetical protein